jgi:chemotaxis protein MotB
MRMTTLTMLALGATAFSLTGCESQQEKDQLSLLQQENTELRTQLDERGKALDGANGELRSANSELRDWKEKYSNAEIEWQSNASPTGGFDGIQGVTATYGPNDVTVSVEGDVLFDSGRTSLKPDARSALDRVAQVLRTQYAGNAIIIAGHTDSDPIRKSGHKSNYHLGFERGWSVRKFLTEKGISSDDIAVMSYGPDRPMGNAQKSRRVEIVVAQ